MLSPPISASAHDGASQPATGSRRRGLSYLRAFSQSRLSGGTPAETPRTSPRAYFNRSISYTEPRNLQESSGRPRSASRPNEPSTRPSQTAEGAAHTSQRRPSTVLESRRSLSASRVRETARATDAVDAESAHSASEAMARHRTLSGRRTTSRNEQAHNPSRNRSTTVTENAEGMAPPRQPTTGVISATNGESHGAAESKGQLPTIRFFPHQELRNGRQSLNFSTVSRTLPSESAVIRVGRYSEREGVPMVNPTTPSDAPVGFKSKVVSRKHCEFSFSDGQWQIKDVASSSGTFLNHIRLSQPNLESRLFPVKDGDIIQLGIDFRGGEEMIFRCVKIRVECNRTWQKRPNNFNKTRHAQLQSLAKDQPTGGENSGECAICLGAVLPCQSLFVAPCAHVWHYKCIRPMLEGANSTYPQFQCPNCRAYTDLSAEVDLADEEMDEWMENAPDDAESVHEPINEDQSETTNGAHTHENTVLMEDVVVQPSSQEDDGVLDVPAAPAQGIVQNVQNFSRGANHNLLSRRQDSNPASPEVRSVNSIDMPNRLERVESNNALQREVTRTGSPNSEEIISGEGPLTPRNNAGPFVFDGSAGRAASGRRLTVPNLHE